ncbi:MAG: hypothetical protein KBS70_07385 [Bacteroidales bacterium]|nr:hypothetical protein [Candidatus Colicola equi]
MLDKIIFIAGIIFSIASLAFTIVKMVKYAVLAKKLKNLTDYDNIYDVAFDAVEFVEGKYKPMEAKGIACDKMKYADVVSVVQAAALKNGWKYEEKELDEIIEKLITFSKSVNAEVTKYVTK